MSTLISPKDINLIIYQRQLEYNTNSVNLRIIILQLRWYRLVKHLNCLFTYQAF